MLAMSDDLFLVFLVKSVIPPNTNQTGKPNHLIVKCTQARFNAMAGEAIISLVSHSSGFKFYNTAPVYAFMS